MGESFQFLDIVLLAIVAGFLILRLRSVLGRRGGHSGPSQDPFAKPAAPRSDEQVIRFPDRPDRTQEPGAGADEAPIADQVPAGLQAGLTQIRVADPSFEVDSFLSGARMAFELILNAFSTGDRSALKALLSSEVFNNFAQSIREREETGETLQTSLIGIKEAEIVEAYMAGRTAHVTVRFVSDQVSVVRNENDEVVEGDPETASEVTDIWTFARDTRSRDPNWALVATSTPD
jgi:predicted lipid-binding transport protein (Tim44 family)